MSSRWYGFEGRGWPGARVSRGYEWKTGVLAGTDPDELLPGVDISEKVIVAWYDEAGSRARVAVAVLAALELRTAERFSCRVCDGFQVVWLGHIDAHGRGIRQSSAVKRNTDLYWDTDDSNHSANCREAILDSECKRQK